MARKRKGKRKKKKKGKGESSRKRLEDLPPARCVDSRPVRAQVCAALPSREKRKKGARRRRSESGEGERGGVGRKRVRERKKGKNIHTNARTCIYIYIYIYGELVTPGSPRPGLDNRDVFRAKNRPGTRVSPRSLALWLRLVGWLGCVRARARAQATRK